MTLLSVVKDVCAVVGVAQPAAVVTAIAVNRTMQEMFTLANEMAQRIAYDNRDWTVLRKTTTMTGDGIATSFPMPADYKRMLLTANVWGPSSQLAPMSFVPDTDEWLNRRARNTTSFSYGEWTMLGGQLLMHPVMSTGATAYYAYLDKNCVNLTGGGVSDAFVADTDTFRLDERLLKLGMIWQWKANKGTSYAEDMGTFSDALAMAMGHDSPAPIIAGRTPMSANAKVAIPSQTIYFPGATP
jgi:hypothetical protein